MKAKVDVKTRTRNVHSNSTHDNPKMGSKPFRERALPLRCHQAEEDCPAVGTRTGLEGVTWHKKAHLRWPRAGPLRKDPTTQRGLPGARTAHVGTSEAGTRCSDTRTHDPTGAEAARRPFPAGAAGPGTARARRHREAGRQGGKDAPPGYFSTTSCGLATTPKQKGQKRSTQDVPGGPEAEILSSACRGLKFDPQSGN